MNARTFLYTSLMARLVAANINGIKRVEMFHEGVLDGKGDYLPTFAGHCLIEIDPLIWESLGAKVQQAECTFSVHIVSEKVHGTGSNEATNTRNAGLEHLERTDQVFALLQGFSGSQPNGTGFGSITRTTELTNHGQKAVLVDELGFKCRLVDYRAKKTLVGAEPEQLITLE